MLGLIVVGGGSTVGMGCRDFCQDELCRSNGNSTCWKCCCCGCLGCVIIFKIAFLVPFVFGDVYLCMLLIALFWFLGFFDVRVFAFVQALGNVLNIAFMAACGDLDDDSH